MSHPALPVLYSFRRCPYAMRARLALFFSAQPYVLREVLLRDKPAEMLALSPKGTVPVLQLPDGWADGPAGGRVIETAGGRVIDESLDIMAWALTQNDPRGLLEGLLSETADGAALIAACDTDFKTHLDRYKYASRYEDDAPPNDPLAHRTAGARFVEDLNRRLAASAYLFGDHATLPDIAIAPFVRQFALADWDWFFATPYPNVHRWLNAFIASAPFIAVMDKFAPWKPGDADTVMLGSTSTPA